MKMINIGMQRTRALSTIIFRIEYASLQRKTTFIDILKKNL